MGFIYNKKICTTLAILLLMSMNSACHNQLPPTAKYQDLISTDITNPNAFLVRTSSNAIGFFDEAFTFTLHNNEIYIADFHNSRINVYDLKGNFKRHWKTTNKNPESLYRPAGITFHNNELYVTSEKSIYTYTPDGKLLNTTRFDDASHNFTDISISNNKARLLDRYLQKIYTIDLQTNKIIHEISDYKGEKFTKLSGLTYNKPLDKLIVSDLATHNIYLYTGSGQPAGRLENIYSPIDYCSFDEHPLKLATSNSHPEWLIVGNSYQKKISIYNIKTLQLITEWEPQFSSTTSRETLYAINDFHFSNNTLYTAIIDNKLNGVIKYPIEEIQNYAKYFNKPDIITLSPGYCNDRSVDKNFTAAPLPSDDSYYILDPEPTLVNLAKINKEGSLIWAAHAHRNTLDKKGLKTPISMTTLQNKNVVTSDPTEKSITVYNKEGDNYKIISENINEPFKIIETPSNIILFDHQPISLIYFTKNFDFIKKVELPHDLIDSVDFIQLPSDQLLFFNGRETNRLIWYNPKDNSIQKSVDIDVKGKIGLFSVYHKKNYLDMALYNNIVFILNTPEKTIKAFNASTGQPVNSLNDFWANWIQNNVSPTGYINSLHIKDGKAIIAVWQQTIPMIYNINLPKETK
jgi:hypothetical protein